MSDDLRRRLLEEARRATLVPQGWAVAWQEGTLELDAATVAWMRGRPPAVQELMQRFPPSCLVRTREGVRLGIPASGTVGVVSSYFEDGTLSVRQAPDADVRAQCDPADLEVVGYYRGLTPERVRAALGG